jgi:hypothetical protein
MGWLGRLIKGHPILTLNMNESPSSPENTVVVTARHLGRLRGLVIASLCLNGLILFLFLLGAIAHHHRMKEDGNFGRGGGWAHCGWGGGFHHHHHFMDRGGWGGPGSFGDGGRRFGGRDGGFDHPEMKDEPGFDQHGGGGGGEKGFGGFGGKHGMGMGMSSDPAAMTDAVLAHLSQTLTLTDDQKAKIKPIVTEQIAQFQKDQEARREAMQKQIKDGLAQIRPLLNADQQKQLDAMPVPGAKAPDADEKPNP